MTPIGAPNEGQGEDVAIFVPAQPKTSSVKPAVSAMASVPDPNPHPKLRLSTKHSNQSLKKLSDD